MGLTQHSDDPFDRRVSPGDAGYEAGESDQPVDPSQASAPERIVQGCLDDQMVCRQRVTQGLERHSGLADMNTMVLSQEAQCPAPNLIDRVLLHPEIAEQSRVGCCPGDLRCRGLGDSDRKSTPLNSSHGYISYAVFCLKKKKI